MDRRTLLKASSLALLPLVPSIEPSPTPLSPLERLFEPVRADVRTVLHRETGHEGAGILVEGTAQGHYGGIAMLAPALNGRVRRNPRPWGPVVVPMFYFGPKGPTPEQARAWDDSLRALLVLPATRPYPDYTVPHSLVIPYFEHVLGGLQHVARLAGKAEVRGTRFTPLERHVRERPGETVLLASATPYFGTCARDGQYVGAYLDLSKVAVATVRDEPLPHTCPRGRTPSEERHWWNVTTRYQGNGPARERFMRSYVDTMSSPAFMGSEVQECPACMEFRLFCTGHIRHHCDGTEDKDLMRAYIQYRDRARAQIALV